MAGRLLFIKGCADFKIGARYPCRGDLRSPAGVHRTPLQDNEKFKKGVRCFKLVADLRDCLLSSPLASTSTHLRWFQPRRPVSQIFKTYRRRGRPLAAPTKQAIIFNECAPAQKPPRVHIFCTCGGRVLICKGQPRHSGTAPFLTNLWLVSA